MGGTSEKRREVKTGVGGEDRRKCVVTRREARFPPEHSGKGLDALSVHLTAAGVAQRRVKRAACFLPSLWAGGQESGRKNKKECK